MDLALKKSQYTESGTEFSIKQFWDRPLKNKEREKKQFPRIGVFGKAVSGIDFS